jgi:DNA mismatch repair protein MutL
MSQTIKILPQGLANKIAAGEVVQRPANAVKELIENAIDAGAKSISVMIKNGGKTFIRIVDDGSGMSHEDAAIAFERHSTSKIATYEDLEEIRTLGFRGEALASIAAISQIELRTRRAADEVGWKIRIEGGAIVENEEVASAAGTSIVVRNLFYNTPGRRNFLKSDSTEFRHVFDVIQRVAISHPELAIKFTSNDEPILELRKASHQERIAGVFGEKLSRTVFAFEQENEFARVSGFLGKPDHARKSRAEQYLFLNERSIINRNISHAVFKAYEHLLEKSSFPFFVLFITIDPRRVDVNVHPSKMEVKFDDEGSMYRFVHSAVAGALSAHDLIPNVGSNVGVETGRYPEGASESTFRPGGTATGQRVTDWRELIRRESPGEGFERIRRSADQAGNAADGPASGQYDAVFEPDLKFAEPLPA